MRLLLPRTRARRSRAPRTRGRRVGGGSLLLAVLGVVVAAAALSGPAAASPAPYPSPAPYSADSAYPGVPPKGSPDRGQGLYLRTCAYCHGYSGEGSQRGPSLVGVGAADVDYYVRSGRMPLPNSVNGIPQQAPRGKPQFDDSDIRALDAYVASLGTPPAPGEPTPAPVPSPNRGGPVPSVHPGDIARGRDLYTEECASCHAPSGIGYTQLSGIIAPSILSSGPQVTADAIRVGPNEMPKFPESVFDQGELDDLVSYVQYLQKPTVGSPGGTSIGRIGAAVEALVGFAFVALLVIVVRLLGKRSAEKRTS